MVVLKTDDEIAAISASCRIARATLDMAATHLRPGITTLELDEICHRFIIEHGATPAPLNYHGFPKSICTSVNEVVCHGIPNAKVRLREGDIINIDVTTILAGWHGDVSQTYIVGSSTSERARKLVACAAACLDAGVAAVADGRRVGDIGAAVQKTAESAGFSVVREYVGHGLGKAFHEDPQVPHYGAAGTGLRLERGMVFTIEPMINEGKWKTRLMPDGWTAVTLDGKLSAQFEHTIAITNSGRVEVLTAS